MGNNYQRLFYIFKNMDSDLGRPTGYIKAEINDGTAKLQILLNNLAGRPGVKYRLYGIKKSEQELKYTGICDIQSENGKADIRLNADTARFGSNLLNFDDINIFAVIAGSSERSSVISCPLVAYKYIELPWKKQFEKELAAPAVPAKPAEIREETPKESWDVRKVTTADPPIPDKIQPEAEPKNDPELFVENAENLHGVFSTHAENIPEEEQPYNHEIQSEPEPDLVKEILRGENGDDTGEAEREPESGSTENIQIEEPDHTYEEEFVSREKDDLSSKFVSTLTSMYNKNDETELSASYNDVLDSAEKNFKEISSIDIEDDRIKGEFNIQGLREELDRSFEVCSPFKAKSRRFQWWKINSPGYLNNILFRNNVKTYLLFNPKVMLAHYKYRYIIFGIRSDKYTGRERFICGVPGVYSIDENPFGSMGSWAQLEGYKPKYGAFGYWIILIDPKTGKLIKIK